MEENLPDWSLFSFVSKSEKAISQMVGGAKDGDGRFVAGLIGIAMALCFFPFSLIGFMLLNGFRVSVKTWVYFIFMVIVIIVAGVGSLIEQFFR
jgi:hypothetical protein